VKGRIGFETAVLTTGAERSGRIHDDVPDLPGIAVGTPDRAAIEDDAEADALSEVDEAKILEVPRGAMEVLADRRCGRIVLDHHGIVEGVSRELRGPRLDQACESRRTGRCHLLDVERSWHDDADAEQLRDGCPDEAANGCDLRLQDRHDRIGICVSQRRRAMRAQPAGHVDEHCRRSGGRHLDSYREGPIRIDVELDRRQAATGPKALSLNEEALVDEFADDVGDGLGAQACMPRDGHAAERSEPAHHVEDDAPVMGSVPLRIGPDRHGVLVRFHCSGRQRLPCA
jgi:hypothetical protein